MVPRPSSGDEVQVEAKVVIAAMGARALMLGLPRERELLGYGVSTCATCDGFFFRGQDIAVVGGGDSALEEAIFLTKFASSVTLVHRRGELRASKIMQERALSEPQGPLCLAQRRDRAARDRQARRRNASGRPHR